MYKDSKRYFETKFGPVQFINLKNEIHTIKVEELVRAQKAFREKQLSADRVPITNTDNS